MLLESLHVGGLQPTVLRLPLVVRRGADLVLPPDLGDQAASIGLFQNEHDLGFSKLRLPHGNLLAKRDYSARRLSL
jgi:hypothetical protein